MCAYKYLHVCVCVNVYACMPTVQSLPVVGFTRISVLRTVCEGVEEGKGMGGQ